MKIGTKSGDHKYSFVTAVGDDHHVNMVHFKNDKQPKEWDPSLTRHYTFTCMTVENGRVKINAFNEKTMMFAKKQAELSFRIVEYQDDNLADLNLELGFESLDGSEQLSSSTKKLRSFLRNRRDVIKGAQIIHVEKR